VHVAGTIEQLSTKVRWYVCSPHII